jgi:predicted MFS family arabinose efflux permease
MTVVSAVIVLQIGVSLPMFLITTLAPYLRAEIRLDERSLGFTVALFHLMSALTAVRLGRLADAQTWQRGTILAGTGLLLPLALLWGLVDSVPLMWVAVGCLAVAQSLSIGTGNLAIFEAVPHDRQGLVFGIKQAAVPIAMMLAGLTAPVVAARLGWHHAFLIPAGFAIVAVLLAAVQSVGQRRSAPPPTPHVDAFRLPALRKRQLRRIAAAIAIGSMTSSSLGAFFVLYAVSRDMTPGQAGVVLALASGANIVSRVGVGWLADRRGYDGFTLAGCMLIGGSLGYVVLLLGQGWVLAVGAMLAYGVGWAWQGLVHLGAVRFAPEAPGYASGVIRTGMSAGAGSGPFLAGLVVAAAGYRPQWMLLSVLAVAAGSFLVVTVRRTAAAPAKEVACP